MRSFEEIESEIVRHASGIENSLVLSEITLKYGLHAFRYGTSVFLKELFRPLGLRQNDVFYDLGSGYGTIILYGAFNYPEVKFKGIEILQERNDICKDIISRSGMQNVTADCKDMLQADLSDGTVFYLFNPLYDFQYAALMGKLEQVASRKSITVIAECRCDFFDQAGWLRPYHSRDINILQRIKYYRS